MSIATLARRVAEWFGRVVAMNEGIDLTGYFDRLEREFSIAFTPDEFERLYTLGDLTALISRKLQEADRPLPEEQIWPAVRRITAYEMGIAESELNEGIRFVEDLNC